METTTPSAIFVQVRSVSRRYSARWPDLVHPHASSIDTPLPKPDQFVDLMLGSAAPWVSLHEGENVDRFDAYPEESIED